MRFLPIRRTALLALSLLSLLFSTACSYTKGNEEVLPTPCVLPGTTVSYRLDIEPILKNNCLKCHGENVYDALGGGYDWTQFGEFQKKAQSGRLIKVIEQVDPAFRTLYMPRNEAKLSACDIERIKAWVAAGAPQN